MDVANVESDHTFSANSLSVSGSGDQLLLYWHNCDVIPQNDGIFPVWRKKVT